MKHSRPSSPSEASGTIEASTVIDPSGARRKLSMENFRSPVIIGVAGASGSGKTSIAGLIAERLELEVKVVALSSDNYYKGLPPNVDPQDYDWDHPSAIDFNLLSAHLYQLSQANTIQVPIYDFTVHKRLQDKFVEINGSKTSVIIVDGILVLAVEEVSKYFDIKIFCSEDADVCLARRLRRDIVERGRSVESVLTQYLRFVKPGYTQFVAPSMNSADFIIPRAKENTRAIELLGFEIQRRVNQRTILRKEFQDDDDTLDTSSHSLEQPPRSPFPLDSSFRVPLGSSSPI
jgi:uridine kinase